MNYRIVSGELTVSKRFFGKESMKPGSPLRQLMGIEGQWSQKVRHIVRDGDLVHIRYGRDDSVYFIEDMSKYLDKVKKSYGDELHGQLVVAKLRGSADFIDFKYDF